ncbi:MAG: hypothetical protein R3C53_18635 [Pirellulaceae bacterium]
MRTLFRQELVLWIALTGALCALFFPGWYHSQVPAFRDGYHFYYPQAVWLEQSARRGELFPTWNPNEGLGVSVAGQPSAALYYPLRVLWFLPGLTLPQRYTVFMLVHLLLAAAGVNYAARSLNLRPGPRWLAAIAFTFSCPVVFQHSNLIFLCSAAWLGFAAGAGIRLLQLPIHQFRAIRGPWIASCVVFAGSVSCMMLAGDPHTAANTLIIAGLAWNVLAVRTFHHRFLLAKHLRDAHPNTGVGAARAAGWLIASCSLIAATTAVQWIPAYRWAKHSSRVKQASVARLDATLPGWNSTPQPVVSHRVYDFSLSPWHLTTVAWPTLGGHFIPRNGRLFALIPAEGRMWIPSLYFGCIPCCLVLHSLSRPRGPGWWLCMLMLVSWLFAIGNYSLVWLIREMSQGLGLIAWANQLPPDHCASLYGLLNYLCPTYSAFRYPAKWTTWFALGCSLLAAWQWNQLESQRSLVLTRITKWLMAISLIGLTACVAGWAMIVSGNAPNLDPWLESIADDRLLGSPTAKDIARSCIWAFALPAFVIACVFGRWGLRNWQWLPWITLIEMACVANHWLIFAPPPLADAHGPTRDAFVWSSPSTDPAQLGKLTTLQTPALHATQSIEPVALFQLRSWLVRHDQLTAHQPNLDEVLSAVGVTHRRVEVQSAKRPAYAWQPIPGAAALCELLETGATLSESSLNWQWHGSCQLEVSLRCDEAQTLIIRQFNDGGWQIADKLSKQRYEIAESPLFIEVQLPAGAHELSMDRKWLW